MANSDLRLLRQLLLEEGYWVVKAEADARYRRLQSNGNPPIAPAKPATVLGSTTKVQSMRPDSNYLASQHYHPPASSTTHLGGNTEAVAPVRAACACSPCIPPPLRMHS
jgi:hypothetical protein